MTKDYSHTEDFLVGNVEITLTEQNHELHISARHTYRALRLKVLNLLKSTIGSEIQQPVHLDDVGMKLTMIPNIYNSAFADPKLQDVSFEYLKKRLGELSDQYRGADSIPDVSSREAAL